MPNQLFSSPFPSCFGSTTTSPTTTTPTPPRPLVSGNPTLTTCLYHTEFGLFGLTWSRNLFGRCSLHLHLQLLLDSNLDDHPPHVSFPPHSTPSFLLHIKPFTFWKKRGSKKLVLDNSTSKIAQVYWDLSSAKFGSRPEPLSGFYVAIVIDGQMTLLVGDSPKEAYASTRATRVPEKNQVMVLRREHVHGNKLYTTKTKFGGRERDISIDCRIGNDPRLYISVDNKRVLQIKHLKWKFRGNERIEVDGVPIQVSWDVHNWLFEDDGDGYALFMLRFEGLGVQDEDEDDCLNRCWTEKNGMMPWSQSQQALFGLGFETKKMKKGLLRSGRSSSSSSLSSASSSSCSSVLEWASTEENELKGPSGFSLVVYAWKNRGTSTRT